MKKMLAQQRICYAICTALLLIAVGCKKTGNSSSTIPFQGPRNPGFESNSDWISATISQSPLFVYKTGTGFLPSQGVYYGYFTNFNSNGAASENFPVANIYQDNVDFSHSTTMTFDYTFTYAPYWSPMPATASVTVQFLFTVNGTVTLWQQTVNAATTPLQVKNASFNLPSLPTTGRFLIQLTAQNGSSTFYPTGIFSIDNIRVN